jgi:hypothetical protein
MRSPWVVPSRSREAIAPAIGRMLVDTAGLGAQPVAAGSVAVGENLDGEKACLKFEPATSR